MWATGLLPPVIMRCISVSIGYSKQLARAHYDTAILTYRKLFQVAQSLPKIPNGLTNSSLESLHLPIAPRSMALQVDRHQG